MLSIFVVNIYTEQRNGKMRRLTKQEQDLFIASDPIVVRDYIKNLIDKNPGAFAEALKHLSKERYEALLKAIYTEQRSKVTKSSTQVTH